MWTKLNKMGFFKSTGKFFGDILKDILAKVISFVIVIGLCILALKWIIGIDVFKLFFG